MVVIPGLTDSLGAVGKRITHFETTEGGFAVDIASTVRSAQCPKCSHHSSRRHGQYRRRLSAEPSMGRPVSLGVEMRRFKCVNRQCSQATFAEQIDALALPKQRRTVGLDGAWRSIAQALGGSAASRLATTLGMPTSRARCCAGCVAWAAMRRRRLPWWWESTTGPSPAGTDMGRSRVISSGAVQSKCWMAVNPRAWPTGCNGILRSRWSPATVQGRTLRPCRR